MSSDPEHNELISRREAIFRVSAMLGSVALVGQSAMLAGCETEPTGDKAASAPNSLFTTRLSMSGFWTWSLA